MVMESLAYYDEIKCRHVMVVLVPANHKKHVMCDACTSES